MRSFPGLGLINQSRAFVPQPDFKIKVDWKLVWGLFFWLMNKTFETLFVTLLSKTINTEIKQTQIKRRCTPKQSMTPPLCPEAPPSSAVNHLVSGLALLAAGASPVQVKQNSIQILTQITECFIIDQSQHQQMDEAGTWSSLGKTNNWLSKCLSVNQQMSWWFQPVVSYRAVNLQAAGGASCWQDVSLQLFMV